MREPQISINGHVLTDAQAMAVRVAVSDFFMRGCDEEYAIELGPIAEGYKGRLVEILQYIGALDADV